MLIHGKKQGCVSSKINPIRPFQRRMSFLRTTTPTHPQCFLFQTSGKRIAYEVSSYERLTLHECTGKVDSEEVEVCQDAKVVKGEVEVAEALAEVLAEVAEVEAL